MATQAAPYRFSYHYASLHGICLYTEGQELILAYKFNLPAATLMELQRCIHESFVCKKVLASEFDTLLTSIYSNSYDSTEQIAASAEESLSLKTLAESITKQEDLLSQEDDAPIARLVNALLVEALRENASDIHFETFERVLIVRFRIDGVLQEMARLQPKLSPVLISRIKVMAKLNIAEKRLPQDGRISIRIAGQDVDVRVSIVPTGESERVVLRLLEKQKGLLKLSNFGFSQAALSSIKQILSLPHGVILITGPTGSGKTTSLYAMLAELNDFSRSILTIEDPIEYYIEGVGQTQVNPRINLSFSQGLRAILRQDPDIVMIGEIRDTETAEIAIQASITGHLVFSTLHTNSACGAVTRLIDMGIEPFLLSSGLAGVIAQRLIRVLCPHCKTARETTLEEDELLGTKHITIYSPTGCTTCRNTGYRGRIAIYEIIPIDASLRALIHTNAPESEMEHYARSNFQTLHSIRQDGFQKVIEGVTSIEEVLRVTNE